jgi:3-deoxy-7-phosphoheptulonate synthase
MIVAFAGERGAFGELAAREYFGGKATLAAQPEFSGVFRSVARGRSRFGVVPIENSLAGSIHENYDLLLESNLHITGEVLLRIRHFLIANKGVSRSKIRKVFSHPMAFAQCKKFLKKFPHLTVVPVSNTAWAVKKIRDENLMDAAAIASQQAAVDFDMQVLARNIEDTKWNTTRFLVLSKAPVFPSAVSRSAADGIKSSVVFSTKNIPGALYKCMSVFALRDINLARSTAAGSSIFFISISREMRAERLLITCGRLRLSTVSWARIRSANSVIRRPGSESNKLRFFWLAEPRRPRQKPGGMPKKISWNFLSLP